MEVPLILQAQNADAQRVHLLPALHPIIVVSLCDLLPLHLEECLDGCLEFQEIVLFEDLV